MDRAASSRGRGLTTPGRTLNQPQGHLMRKTIRRIFGKKKEREESAEQRRKKRKKTLRGVTQVRYGDVEKKKALMDEITDIDQYRRR